MDVWKDSSRVAEEVGNKSVETFAWKCRSKLRLRGLNNNCPNEPSVLLRAAYIPLLLELERMGMMSNGFMDQWREWITVLGLGARKEEHHSL
jgi:hypothetical protein